MRLFRHLDSGSDLFRLQPLRNRRNGTMIKSVCLYCGSSPGNSPRYREAAAELGATLAARGVRLVFGGGQVGLMGIAADAALAAGGTVIGVIPQFLIDREAGHRGISELVVVETMHERKQKMFELVDGFVVLPGGLGTFDETIEILTWRQLRLHDKPVVILDVDGYWREWLSAVGKAIESGFARPEVRNLFTVATAVADILPALEASPHDRIKPAAGRL